MAESKTFEIVYSRQKTDYVEGRAYANPRFFTRPRLGVTKVLLVGDWPTIEAAYKALGVPVERVDASEVTAGVEPMEVKEAAALIPTVPDDERDAIYIPDDWRDLPWSRPAEGRDLTLRGLAAMFSAEPVLNKAQAVAAVEAEMERRARGAETETEGGEGPNGYLHPTGPLRQRERLASVCQPDRIAPIAELSGLRRPPNIARLVIPVIVDAINGRSCRSLAHMSQEGRKPSWPLPLGAYRYAATAIFRIVARRLVPTPRNHVQPAIVRRGSVHPMRGVRFN